MAAKPPAVLLQASHVYVRRGGALPPLAPLYVGPYEVLERADKYFRLAVGGREETVSIDRLKPHLGVGPVRHSIHNHTYECCKGGGGRIGRGELMIILTIWRTTSCKSAENDQLAELGKTSLSRYLLPLVVARYH